MDSDPKVLLVILLTLVVGSYGGLKLMSKSAGDAPPVAQVEEAAVANAPAAAPTAPLADEPSVTISYQIQACVDDKATLTLQGDKIMWNEMTGAGLASPDCAPDVRNKTTVVVRNSADGTSEAISITDLKADTYYGKLYTPIPGQELLAPATVQILSAGDAAGRVTVTEQPTGPRYRVRLLFDDANAYAHEYAVLLTLKYRATPALGAR